MRPNIVERLKQTPIIPVLVPTPTHDELHFPWSRNGNFCKYDKWWNVFCWLVLLLFLHFPGCVCACMCVYVCVCMCMCVCVCVWMCVDMWVCVCMICLYVCQSVCMCMCVYLPLCVCLGQEHRKGTIKGYICKCHFYFLQLRK